MLMTKFKAAAAALAFAAAPAAADVDLQFYFPVAVGGAAAPSNWSQFQPPVSPFNPFNQVQPSAPPQPMSDVSSDPDIVMERPGRKRRDELPSSPSKSQRGYTTEGGAIPDVKPVVKRDERNL